MGFLDNSYDNPDEDEKRRERAISVLSAIAKESRGEAPVDMDLRNDLPTREAEAFNAERDRLANRPDRGTGVPDDASMVDPGRKLSPEQFLVAANSPDRARADLDQRMPLDGPGAQDTPPPTAAAVVEVDNSPVRESLTLDAPDAIRGLTGREPRGRERSPVNAREEQARGDASAAERMIADRNAAPEAPKDARPELDPLAVLTDFAVNKGHGIADIVGVLNGQRNKYDADQIATAKGKLEAEYKQAQIRHLDGSTANDAENAHIRGRELEFSQDKLLHPEKFPLTKEQELQRDNIAADNKRADAQMDATAAEREYSHGQDAARLKLGYDQLNQGAADRSAGREAAAARQKELDDERAAARGDRAKAVSDQHDQQFATRFSKDTEKVSKQLGLLKSINDIVDQYGWDPETGQLDASRVPGLDRSLGLGDTANDAIGALSHGYKVLTGQSSPEDDSRREAGDTLRKNMMEAEQARLRGETGSAAALREEDKTAIRTGMGLSASPEQRLKAIQVMQKVATQQMQSFGAANPRVARQVLESQGLDPEMIPLLQQAAAAQSGNGGPPPVPAGDSFSTTRGAIPKVGDVMGQTRDDSTEAPGASSGDQRPVSWQIKGPDGTVYTKTKTQAEIDRFLSANPKWSLVQ